MPYVESKTTIKGDGAKIYDIIKDMAAYPNFMHDLVSVEILERGENYTVSDDCGPVEPHFKEKSS